MARPWPRVLITRRLPERALARVAAACDVTLYDGGAAMPRDRLLAQVAGKAGTITLLTGRVDDEFLTAAGPQLSVVANYAAGFDNIDLDACSRRGVLATNAPDVLADTAADMAFALMIGAARRAAGDDRLLRSRRQPPPGPPITPGHVVDDKTLGIAGFGRIGQALARRASSSGMNVVYHRTLEDLLREADVVSLHANLAPGTRHLINAERLAMMKPTALLVDTSGGLVVDEQALACALREGRIAAAAIDVIRREPDVHADLLACHNALVVRHLGTAAVPARLVMANLAVDNLLASLHGERPPCLLNPQAWLERSARARRLGARREKALEPAHVTGC
jgi:glyoxylate reductase